MLKIKPLKSAQQRFLSVIYGPPGSGKTYGSCTLKGKTLLIDFDHGTSAIPDDADVTILDVADYTELIAQLPEVAESDFDNIVFDTLTKLQKKLVESYTPPISIKDWGVIAGKLNKVITKLDDLSAKGKNVIILCQEKLLDEDHPDKMLSTVDILPSVRSDLTAAARVIGRTYIAKDGTHGIAVSPHAHRITKVSVYGVDTEGITSFKELLERIKNK